MDANSFKQYLKNNNKLGFRPDTLAKSFDLSPAYIRAQIKNGKLRARKPAPGCAAPVLITVDAVLDWLAAMEPVKAES